MGFAIFLLLLAVLLGVFMAGYSVGNRRSTTRTMTTQDYLAERTKAIIAAKALREVANGAGSPILSAQIALDDIERLEHHQLENRA